MPVSLEEDRHLGPVSRRVCLGLLLAPLVGSAQKAKIEDPLPPGDWVCPMDPDVHSDKPGACPRCGMKLIVQVPERVEYALEVGQSPELLKPGAIANLTFRVLDPRTGKPVTRFDIVHEKLMHLFLVSENLEFFAHEHPTLQRDGTFKLSVRLPRPGMYRMLADYYPSGSVPQLSVKTLFVAGASVPARIEPRLTPSTAANLTASLRLDPEEPLAGLETKLFYDLNPATGLEPYLGAWAHMLAVSEDLVDLVHTHPFIADGGPTVQFNLVFPRPGLFRIWTQFQRQGVVDTTVFTVPVKAL